METLYATDNQTLLGTTCRIQAAKQYVPAVPNSVSTASKTFSRVTHNSVSRPLMQLSPTPQPVQSGSWTTEEDKVLCDYRIQGHSWTRIQENQFPNKSANACRKRYERLVAKRRSPYWDETRLENLAVNYCQIREHTWRPLANRLREKWEDVEKACMQQGLRGLQNRAANHRRNQPSVSSSSKVGNFSASEKENRHHHGYDEYGSQDDSGIFIPIDCGDREVQKESSSQLHGVKRTAEEAHLRLPPPNSDSESTQSSRPLPSLVFSSHTAHPMQQYSRGPPPLGRPAELHHNEEADLKHIVGREDLGDRILHFGRDQPPSPPHPDRRTSISPSSLREFAPAMHTSEVPEVLSLRRDAEGKHKNIEGLKVDLNSIREHDKNPSDIAVATNKEKRSLQRQVHHLRGELPRVSQMRSRSQEENAERIQALRDTDRQPCDAEQCVLDAIGTEKDQARRGLMDIPKCSKSPPVTLSLSPQIRQEAHLTITAPRRGQQRDDPSRRCTSTSECMEDSRHRRAGLLVEAQVSPYSAEALDNLRADCSLSGFTSESERSFTDSAGSSMGYGTGCDQLNGLLQELHEALVREMVKDYMATTENPGCRAHTPSNSSASSNSNTEFRKGDSAPPKPSNAAKGRGKRHRGDEDDGGNDEEEDETPDRRRHKRQGTAGSNSDVIPEKLFACPYFKLDPLRYSQRNVDEKKYRGCSSCYLMDISRLKQHLYRVHGRPDYYCGSCFKEFKTRVLLDAHTRQRPSCTLSKCPFDEKMDSDQKNQIKRRRFGQNPSEAWCDIWKFLFPNSDMPESPFSEIASTVAVQSLFERFRTRAPLMLSRLVSDRIQDSIYLAQHQQLLLENAQEEAMAEIIQIFRGEFEDLELSKTAMSSNDRSLSTGRHSTPSGPLCVSVVPMSDRSTRVNAIPLAESVSPAASGAPLIEYSSSQTLFSPLPTLGLSLTPGEVTGPSWSYSNKWDDRPFFGNMKEQTGADALARSSNSGARQPDVAGHEHHLWQASSAATNADYPWFDDLASGSHVPGC